MKAKTKKVLTGIGALTLTAVISIGGTFAYLTKLTEKRANNFTFASKGLNAILTEPEWDGIVDYKYDDEEEYVRPVYEEGEDVYGYYTDESDDSTGNKKRRLKYTPEKLNELTEGDNPEEWDIDDTTDPGLREWVRKTREKKNGQPLTYEDYERPDEVTVTESDGSKKKKRAGYLEAQDMIPGQEAKKNPFITNTGGLNEWVAAKVTFVYSDTGEKIPDNVFGAITDIIQINWNTTAWTYRGNETLVGEDYVNGMAFYYNDLLEASGDKTVPLFTTVTVDPEATNEEIKALEAIGGFTIYIEGYAVQEEQYTAATWKTEGEAGFPTDNATGRLDNTDNIGISPKAKQ